MAKIGSLTVDLTLKSAEFIRDLSKSSQAVATNTQRMTKSINALTAGFAGLVSARMVRQIANVTEESLKLAASMSGPLSDSARKFLLQFEELQTAFQLGLASGFMDGLNNGLLNSAANMKTATDAGKLFGQAISFIASESATFFGQELPRLLDDLMFQFTELKRVWMDFQQLLTGDFSVITGGVSDFAKTVQGNADALATYGTEAELAALATEAFWSATTTLTTDGEHLLRTLEAQRDIMRELRTPAEEYAAALDRIAMANLSGEEAARANSAATAMLVGNYLQLADNIGTALGTMFKELKAVAIVQAVINTAQAITKTFAEYGATPWGFALAASMAAMGAAQIAAISSSNPGSGSKAMKKTSGGGTGSAAARAGSASRTAAAAPGQTVTIKIVGDVFGPEHFRKIVSGINGVQRDGTALLQVA